MSETVSQIRSYWKDGALYVAKNGTATGSSDTILIISSTGTIYYGPFLGINQQTVNVTAATALSTAGSLGITITCTTDSVVLTLPGSSTTLVAGLTYTIINTATDGAAMICVRGKTVSADPIVGLGTISSDAKFVIKNTSTTHIYGDQITLIASDSAAGKANWSLDNVIGTWALSATS